MLGEKQEGSADALTWKHTHTRTHTCTVMRSLAAGHTQVLELHSIPYKDGRSGEHGPFRME